MFGGLNDLRPGSKHCALKAREAALHGEEPEALAFRDNDSNGDVTKLDDAGSGHGKPRLFTGSHR
jgi:hypothetical protein